jgi:general secretion pathway protein B
MSYILEALKKSQQERELGRVPTLETAGIFEDDKVAQARGHWPVVAVGLAAVAMILALYAALRVPVQVPPSLPAAAGASGATTGNEPDTVKARGQGGTGPGEAMVAAMPRSESSAVGGPAPFPGPVAATTAPAGPAAPHTPAPLPLIEPPPVKQAGRIRLPDPTEVVRARGDSHGFDPDPAHAPDLDQELELQRQLEAEQVELWHDEPIADPAPTPVPRDLIADIESFKREVRGAGNSEKPPSKALSNLGDKELQGLRLTPAQEAELPPYLMTVHVYDLDRGRRFVLINGVKYREGERTREGITVERILAQGAVLSHKGNPFYVPR